MIQKPSEFRRERKTPFASNVGPRATYAIRVSIHPSGTAAHEQRTAWKLYHWGNIMVKSDGLMSRQTEETSITLQNISSHTLEDDQLFGTL